MRRDVFWREENSVCVIIDVNIAKDVLVSERIDFAPLIRAVYAGRLPVVHGGQLTKEYQRHGEVMDVIAELDQAGLARRIDDAAIEVEYKKIAKRCTSDDQHILAIARACGARLLCTNDSTLQEDFCEKSLVDKPRGKIYKNEAHKHLLRTACERCA
jgi:predicted nucleic acid-binding protein